MMTMMTSWIPSHAFLFFLSLIVGWWYSLVPIEIQNGQIQPAVRDRFKCMMTTLHYSYSYPFANVID
jgi:hypothetical protein